MKSAGARGSGAIQILISYLIPVRILGEVRIDRGSYEGEREEFMLSFLEAHIGTQVFRLMSVYYVVATVLLAAVLPYKSLIACLRLSVKLVVQHGNSVTGGLDNLRVTPADHIGPAASLKPELEFLLPLDYIHGKF